MAFSLPQQIVKLLSLREGMRVADFGAGSGHYTFAAAPKVPGGRVCSIDIQKDLLKRIKNEALRQGFTNIEVVWGDIDEEEGSRLKAQSMDAVILANTLFQLEHRTKAVEEIKRVLKPKGRVLFIDWTDSFSGLGPNERDVIKKEDAKKLFEQIGFSVVKDITEKAGDHHYGFIFERT